MHNFVKISTDEQTTKLLKQITEAIKDTIIESSNIDTIINSINDIDNSQKFQKEQISDLEKDITEFLDSIKKDVKLIDKITSVSLQIDSQNSKIDSSIDISNTIKSNSSEQLEKIDNIHSSIRNIDSKISNLDSTLKNKIYQLKENLANDYKKSTDILYQEIDNSNKNHSISITNLNKDVSKINTHLDKYNDRMDNVEKLLTEIIDTQNKIIEIASEPWYRKIFRRNRSK